MSWRFRGVLFERSEFRAPPAHPSIAGNPKGKHAGGLSFGTFSLAIKEKILAHEGRKHQINSRNQIKKESISRTPA
ncbi:MAG: hypothetical protein U9N50_11040 [Pseudomonadota bacterium]|nr:hypothetical protein [Pseudomonadota bacterium]